MTLQKNYLPKSHQQNRPNSAKMLKKICLNLPNSAKMLKKICLKNKIIRNKIWSIQVVKKYLFSNEKKFQPDLTSFDPSKKLSAKIALKLYFRKNWGTKSVFSHYVHKLVRKSTFHILYIKLYINLFKIHCFWFFQQNFVLKFGWNWVQTMVHPSV